MAESLNVSPEGVLVGATLGASCAFMMPVGTPPNAMVFGTGRIKIAEMIRAGFWLNIIAIVIIVVGVMLLSGNILPT